MLQRKLPGTLKKRPTATESKVPEHLIDELGCVSFPRMPETNLPEGPGVVAADLLGPRPGREPVSSYVHGSSDAQMPNCPLCRCLL